MVRISFLLLLVFVFLFSLSSRVKAQSQHTWSVQIASYRTEAEARTLTDNLRLRGVEAFWTRGTFPGKGIFYRVQAGKFSSMSMALSKGAEWRSRRLIAAFVIANENGPLPQQSDIPVHNSVSSPRRSESHLTPNRQVTAVAAWAASREPAPRPSVKAGPEAASATGSAANRKTASTANATPAASVFKVTTTVANTATTKSITRSAAGALHPTAEKGNVFFEEDAPHSPLKSAESRPPVKSALTEIIISNPAWQVIRYSSSTEKHLRAIHFTDAKTGWVAGDSGTVQRTLDGGRTWQKLNHQADASVSYIHFADQRHGWMLGSVQRKNDPLASLPNAADTTDHSPVMMLFRTTDGGDTWKQQPLAGVTRLQFRNVREGWAVGHQATLLRTMDGGITWQRFEELARVFNAAAENSGYSFGFSDVHFTDAQRGWLIGNFTSQTDSQIGGVYVTRDGGNTWQRVALPIEKNSDGIGSSQLIPGQLRAIRFTDASNGWISGEIQAGSAKRFFVLRTSDGGKTWKQSDSPGDAQWFSGMESGWTTALNASQDYTNADYDAEILRTDNGGRRWLSDVTLRGSRIRRLFFLSASQGWAVGDNGMILRYEERR